MLKILVIRKVINGLHNTSEFFGLTVDGAVPERFWAYPYLNGDEVEGFMVNAYPVQNAPGVEAWAERNNAEEVNIEACDDFLEQHTPKDVRWFVDKKSPAAPASTSTLKRLLSSQTPML